MPDGVPQASFTSVPDRRPSGKVRANAAAHHLCIVADVEVTAGPERAVRDAARDWGEADVFPFRRKHVDPAAAARPDVSGRIGFHAIAARAADLLTGDELPLPGRHAGT